MALESKDIIKINLKKNVNCSRFEAFIYIYKMFYLNYLPLTIISANKP